MPDQPILDNKTSEVISIWAIFVFNPLIGVPIERALLSEIAHNVASVPLIYLIVAHLFEAAVTIGHKQTKAVLQAIVP